MTHSLEVHHPVGVWNLILCKGSRYGKTLNDFLDKTARDPTPTIINVEVEKPGKRLEKPEFCEKCHYFVRNNIHKSSTLVSHKCRLTGSYSVKPTTKACEQALPRQRNFS